MGVAEDRALDRFIDDMDEVLHVMVSEGWNDLDAIDHLLGEYDEFYRVLLEEEEAR